MDINGMSVSLRADFHPEFDADLLGGVTRLTGAAHTTPSGALYGNEVALSDAAPVRVTAIPYYAWANREPGDMTVWVAAE